MIYWPYLIAGLGLLYCAAQILVSGGAALALRLGLSALVVGLTVIAYGTGMPELATSLVAAVRGHSEVAIGNVVGSNIFNVFGILGIAALINPIDTSGLSRVDLVTMVVAALAMLPAARSGGVISRLEGPRSWSSIWGTLLGWWHRRSNSNYLT
jgi:cation:H+ antiporter